MNISGEVETQICRIMQKATYYKKDVKKKKIH